MIRSKHKECPVCDYPFFNADEATRTQYFGTVFKKRCSNCGTFFEYSHNEKFDDYYYMILEPHKWDPFKITEKLPGIKKIISNDPATVILWEDGTKTMAKCQDCDEFDFEKGVLICSLKKLIGNKATNELLKRMESQPKKSKSCKDCQFDKVAFTNFPCDRCREKDGLRTEFMPKLCQSCKHLEETYEDGPCYECLGVYRKNRSHPNWEPEE